jgi:hypothetical protein
MLAAGGILRVVAFGGMAALLGWGGVASGCWRS